MFEPIAAFKNVKKGDKVFFIQDKKYYRVDGIDRDVLYLNDPFDGSSFTATEDEVIISK